MLTLFIISFIFFLLITIGMSLGYLVKRKSLQGSCGGITSLGMEKFVIALSPVIAAKSDWLKLRHVKKNGRNTVSYNKTVDSSHRQFNILKHRFNIFIRA